jgi:hypothetical protein
VPMTVIRVSPSSPGLCTDVASATNWLSTPRCWVAALRQPPRPSRNFGNTTDIKTERVPIMRRCVLDVNVNIYFCHKTKKTKRVIDNKGHRDNKGVISTTRRECSVQKRRRPRSQGSLEHRVCGDESLPPIVFLASWPVSATRFTTLKVLQISRLSRGDTLVLARHCPPRNQGWGCVRCAALTIYDYDPVLSPE